MKGYSHKSHLIKRQHQWWKTPNLLFSQRYSFQVMAIAITLIAFGSLAHVWQWTRFVQLGYQVQKLETEKKAIVNRIDLLEIEISYLSRLDRLDHLATSQLKMKPPSLNQRLSLNPHNPNE